MTQKNWILMDVAKSVKKAIDEWEANDLDSAILHSCNAVDGTARKHYGAKAKGGERFTRLLRENYSILGPMSMPGINLDETRFPVKVRCPKASGGRPDLADVIYGIHRCCHGHGEALPEGFELVPDTRRADLRTTTHISNGRVRLSDRVIFGLIAVAVLAPANADKRGLDGYHLTLGDAHTLPINDWWGRAEDFLSIAKTCAIPLVTLEFADWME